MKYIIAVQRTATKEMDIEVEASSPEEAKEKALEKACNTVFTTGDFSVEYEEVGIN
jgi:hypothetical protein